LTNFENNPIQREVSDIPNLFRGNVGCLAILKPANCGKRCSTLTEPLDEAGLGTALIVECMSDKQDAMWITFILTRFAGVWSECML